jgi:hypothetical protein
MEYLRHAIMGLLLGGICAVIYTMANDAAIPQTRLISSANASGYLPEVFPTPETRPLWDPEPKVIIPETFPNRAPEDRDSINLSPERRPEILAYPGVWSKGRWNRPDAIIEYRLR